jgi:hypothetical protein
VTSPAAVIQRSDLGVDVAQPGVETLTDYLAVAHEHGADERVRADSPPAALSELERPAQMGAVLVCGDESHHLSGLTDWSVNESLLPLRRRYRRGTG